MLVVDLADWPRFFVRAAMGSAGWPCFRFIGISIMGVDLGGVDSLAIGEAVSTGVDVAIGFSGLSLW